MKAGENLKFQAILDSNLMQHISAVLVNLKAILCTVCDYTWRNTLDVCITIIFMSKQALHKGT